VEYKDRGRHRDGRSKGGNEEGGRQVEWKAKHGKKEERGGVGERTDGESRAAQGDE